MAERSPRCSTALSPSRPIAATSNMRMASPGRLPSSSGGQAIRAHLVVDLAQDAAELDHRHLILAEQARISPSHLRVGEIIPFRKVTVGHKRSDRLIFSLRGGITHQIDYWRMFASGSLMQLA